MGEVGLLESRRCKEADFESDTVLAVLVWEPAAAAFLLFASSRASTSARDNCTGGGANIVLKFCLDDLQSIGVLLKREEVSRVSSCTCSRRLSAVFVRNPWQVFAVHKELLPSRRFPLTKHSRFLSALGPNLKSQLYLYGTTVKASRGHKKARFYRSLK